ncbi:MAG TPA: DUF1501 domain-containing protein [Lacipirellulaceae bacterium]|nr:DUF1501 domain-containing protein [Lacipirellulaceae bacterium]
MSCCEVPNGMSRRHFMRHLAGASALVAPAFALTRTLRANAKSLSRNHKSAILLWLGGGPPSIDMWDLKPGAPTAGEFKPISTTGDFQICELMPSLAKQGKHLSVIRSMSTREADHNRGRYYMHTAYVPSQSVEHPGYGSVVAHEMEKYTTDLQIPPFVSIGGASEGPGFLGMAYAPFQVDANGQIRNAQMTVPAARMVDRMKLLGVLEARFISERRGSAADEHAKILRKTQELLTSDQMKAFKVRSEPKEMLDKYGDNNFGRGCLMARRLVEVGVPFVEVTSGGWDLHQQNFTTLKRKLPELDKGFSALVEDLKQHGLLDSTVILCMGEFGRTPRINGNAGRDHYARAWSVAIGGAGIRGGRAIGKTNADGTSVEGESHSSEDLMASVCHALGISLQITYTAKNGRPMKIAGGGKVIQELFA